MNGSGVEDALCRARAAVDVRFRSRIDQGAQATEEELTIELLMAAHPDLVYQEFNRTEEGRIGADWLWWFVSGEGECFGILVQAKKLKRSGDSWNIDLGYTVGNSGQTQMGRLLRSADHFGVAASYLLYCGDTDYRGGLVCGPQHQSDGCELCLRSGVTVVAGLVAKRLHGLGSSGEDVFQVSRPLEQLVSTADDRVLDLNLRAIDDLELSRLLLERQVGHRAVAKHLFAQLAQDRLGALSAAAVLLENADVEDQVFTSFPDDTGHFGSNYYSHLFRGLRRSLPPEIRPLLEGGSLDSDLFPGLDGVVLVRLDPA